MNDHSRAIANRSIRTIKTELDYLLDSSLLTQQQATAILALLPAPITASSPIPPNISNLNIVDEKQSGGGGWYAPSPGINQDYQPPAYAPPQQQQQQQPPPLPPQQHQPPPPTTLTYATATYAYTPTDPGDLALAPQDRIAVTEYMNAEWWKGRSERTGQVGIFPRSYVREETSGGGFPVQQKASYGGGGGGNNMPMAVAQGPVDGQGRTPGKGEEMAKKAGKKLGNAALFGAGATIGSNIVNSIF